MSDLLISYTLILFVLGLILGSFYNVVGLRVPKNQSVSHGRSMCMTCNRTLRWYELIPVVSYLIQFGRCRKCGDDISMIYPTMEFASGFLFAYSYYMFGFTYELFTALVLVSISLILFVSDIRYMIIPNNTLLFFLPIIAIARMITPLDPWYDSLFGAAVGFSIIAIIIMLSNGGMGAGDMKLMGVLGLILGLKGTLMTLLLSFFIGTVIGITLLAIGVLRRGQPFPFGPSILLAALIVYFHGDILMGWYMQFF